VNKGATLHDPGYHFSGPICIQCNKTGGEHYSFCPELNSSKYWSPKTAPESETRPIEDWALLGVGLVVGLLAGGACGLGIGYYLAKLLIGG
jgi:hypothetical protein